MSYYSKLASMCADCPNVDTCDHKRMEACATIEMPIIDGGIGKSVVENPSVSVNVIVDQEGTELAKKILNKMFGMSCLGGGWH